MSRQKPSASNVRIEKPFSFFFSMKLVFAPLVTTLDVDKIQGEHLSYKYSFGLRNFHQNLNEMT